jgi:hypothetical protein
MNCLTVNENFEEQFITRDPLSTIIKKFTVENFGVYWNFLGENEGTYNYFFQLNVVSYLY